MKRTPEEMYKLASMNRRAETSKSVSKIRDAMRGVPSHTAALTFDMSMLSGNNSINTDQNATVKALSMVSTLLNSFSIPMKPRLMHLGTIKNASEGSKSGASIIRIGATLQTLLGHKAQIDIPVMVHDRSLIEPSVFFYEGAPYVMCASAINELIKRGSMFKQTKIRGMYSSPVPQSVNEQQLPDQPIMNRDHMFNPGSQNPWKFRRYSQTNSDELRWEVHGFSDDEPDYLVEKFNDEATATKCCKENNQSEAGKSRTTPEDWKHITFYVLDTQTGEKKASVHKSQRGGQTSITIYRFDDQEVEHEILVKCRYIPEHTPSWSGFEERFQQPTEPAEVDIISATMDGQPVDLTSEEEREVHEKVVEEISTSGREYEPDDDRFFASRKASENILDPADRDQEEYFTPGTEVATTEQVSVYERGGTHINIPKGETGVVLRDTQGDNKVLYVCFPELECEAIVPHHQLKVAQAVDHKPCEKCNGLGKICDESDDQFDPYLDTCPECDGSGRVSHTAAAIDQIRNEVREMLR